MYIAETKQVAEYAPQQDKPRCEPADTLLVWDGARAGLAGRGIEHHERFDIGLRQLAADDEQELTTRQILERKFAELED